MEEKGEGVGARLGAHMREEEGGLALRGAMWWEEDDTRPRPAGGGSRQ
jgi:hypothetical protein